MATEGKRLQGVKMGAGWAAAAPGSLLDTDSQAHRAELHQDLHLSKAWAGVQILSTA